MADPQTLLARWSTYQRERFPLLKTVPLTAALAAAGLSFASFDWLRFALFTCITTCLFFQLRVADEHKDFATDLRYRPERPVPRGLITLAELRRGLALVVVLQIGVAWIVGGWALLAWLALTEFYIGLMWAEFGVGSWLQQRPLVYLVSHMVVMPLIAAAPIAAAERWTADGVGWFLAFAFFCGIVLEVGRKIRRPMDERTGVETYSALYGADRAYRLWCVALVAATLCTWSLLPLLYAGALTGCVLGVALSPRTVWQTERQSGLFVLIVLILIAIRGFIAQ